MKDNLLYVLALSLMLIGCSGLSQPDMPIDGDKPGIIVPTDLEEYSEDSEFVLGEKKENPYNIEVMQKAFDILLHTPILKEAVNIPTEPHINYIYYRVLPEDSLSFEILLSDTSVQYMGIPLDREIVHYGAFYKDDDLRDFPYSWMYAVVPIRKSLPQVGKVEILDKLFVPAEREDVEEGQIDGVGVLEYVAYKLTYNLSEWENEDIIYYEDLLSQFGMSNFGEIPNLKDISYSEKYLKARKRWLSKAYPSGNFSVYNSITDDCDGISGAKVLIHNFVKIYSGVLDEKGNYSSTTAFRTKAYYWIRFYNVPTQTSIFPKVPLIGSALYPLKKNPKYGVDRCLYPNSVAWRYATINNTLVKNAKFNYEYEIPTAKGLRIWVLPSNGKWEGSTPLLHYAKGIYHTATDWLLVLCGVPYAVLITPDMFIFADQGDEKLTTSRLSKTMYHELAHVAHYMYVGDDYWDNYITHIIFNAGYGTDQKGWLAGYCGVGEMWGTYGGLYYLAKDMGYPKLYEITTWYEQNWYKPNIMIRIGNLANKQGYSFANLYRVLKRDVHSLESLREGWIRMGLEPAEVDKIIDQEKYWEN